MVHTKLHFGCCLMPSFGILLWVAAFVSFIFAWVSGGGFFWGRAAVDWYWDALVLGVLAIGVKLGVIISYKKGSCKDCSCGSGNCEKCSHEEKIVQ